MCPACLSTMVWIAAGAGSTGGAAALLVKKLRGKEGGKRPGSAVPQETHEGRKKPR